MIVIYDTLGAYGGSHTLMMRMCRWMHENGTQSAIICTSDANKEVIGELGKYGVRIIHADLKNLRIGKDILQEFLKVDDIKVFTFSWNYYLDIECLKRKYNLRFDNILYCIHPATFKKGIGFKSSLMRRYSILSYRKIYERMCANRAVVSLDEINIEESENYLGCHVKREPDIVRLPMYCEEREDYEDIIRRGFGSNTILTAARADFPYKGYMMGLLDDYVALKETYPDVKLEMVTSGDDYAQLLEKLDRVPEQYREDILLHGWMKYDALREKMRECRVFIGMGTTVFDAALQYKPAVVVLYSTLDCISDHFISERPKYMGSEPGCTEPALNRLRQAFEWDTKRYRSECIKSFYAVRNLYDINICMKKLVNKETRYKGSILSAYECVRHDWNHKLNDVRYRGRKFADYNKLVYDR